VISDHSYVLPHLRRHVIKRLFINWCLFNTAVSATLAIRVHTL